MQFMALFIALPLLAWLVDDPVWVGGFIMAWLGLIFIFLLHLATTGLSDLIKIIGGK